MKVFVCLFALIACAQAGVLHAPVAVAHAEPVAHAAVLSTGSSTQSRTQDAAGNYAFAYNEQHATGGSSRQESGSPGVATGSYTLNVADGRQRVVNYVADALGYRAAIATNEPGTAAQPAASTAISSPHLPPAPVAPVAHAPALVHAEPVAVAAPVAVAHAHAPALAVAHADHYYGHNLGHHLAGPVLAAPVVHSVPVVSSYSTAVNHGHVVAAAAVPHAHWAPNWAPALVNHAPLHY